MPVYTHYDKIIEDSFNVSGASWDNTLEVGNEIKLLSRIDKLGYDHFPTRSSLPSPMVWSRLSDGNIWSGDRGDGLPKEADGWDAYIQNDDLGIPLGLYYVGLYGKASPEGVIELYNPVDTLKFSVPNATWKWLKYEIISNQFRIRVTDPDDGIGRGIHKIGSLSFIAVNGVYISRVLDAGREVDWYRVTWSKSVPVYTRILVRVRFSKDNVSWTSWSDYHDEDFDIDMKGYRYAQYEITLERTAFVESSPIVYDFRLYFYWEVITTLQPPETSHIIGGHADIPHEDVPFADFIDHDDVAEEIFSDHGDGHSDFDNHSDTVHGDFSDHSNWSDHSDVAHSDFVNHYDDPTIYP